MCVDGGKKIKIKKCDSTFIREMRVIAWPHCLNLKYSFIHKVFSIWLLLAFKQREPNHLNFSIHINFHLKISVKEIKFCYFFWLLQFLKHFVVENYVQFLMTPLKVSQKKEKKNSRTFWVIIYSNLILVLENPITEVMLVFNRVLLGVFWEKWSLSFLNYLSNEF